ncbi:hypothetical protein JCM10207_004157 [Rhodosporidiobolus poonsookiae]
MSTPADDALLASLRAATTLSLSDLRSLNDLATSSPRFGASQDELVARNLWREELRRFSATLDDGEMARDLQEALRRGVRVETVRREREERSSAGAGGLGDDSDSTETSGDSDIERRIAQLHVSSSSTASTSSSSAFPSKTGNAGSFTASVGLVCFVCLERTSTSTMLACGHRYCADCLKQLFLLATKDESLNPASCCKISIPPSYAKLSPAELGNYTSAAVEFKTKNRLYCSNNTCSTFLGEATSITSSLHIVTCPKCYTQTCSVCKSPAHPSTTACAADSDDLAASKLAAQVRGVRCDSCERVVERNGGFICLCGEDLRIGGDDEDDYDSD